MNNFSTSMDVGHFVYWGHYEGEKASNESIEVRYSHGKVVEVDVQTKSLYICDSNGGQIKTDITWLYTQKVVGIYFPHWTIL